jgi:hypothetical protein
MMSRAALPFIGAAVLAVVAAVAACGTLCADPCTSAVLIRLQTPDAATLSTYSGSVQADERSVPFVCPNDPTAETRYACIRNGIQLYGTPVRVVVQVEATSAGLVGELDVNPEYATQARGNLCESCSQAEVDVELHST